MKSILIAIVMIAAQTLQAQSYTIRHKGTDKGIAIKILPKDAHSWLTGIDHGYIIERKELSDTSFVRLNKELLTPAAQNEWPQSELGKGMLEFHNNAVEKTRILKNETALWQRVKNSFRANQNYSIYAFITMRDSIFGQYSGLEYMDDTVEEGIEYVYKVTVNNTNHEAALLVASNNTRIHSPNLKVENQEQMVRLSWLHEANGDNTAYFIERSEDGINFNKVSDTPVLATPPTQEDTLQVVTSLTLSYTDTLNQNYKPYQYRLQAIDLWGDDCVPSEIVEAMGVDKTAPVITGLNVQSDTIAKSIKVTWNESIDDDVEQYFVTVSESRKMKDSVIVSGISRLGLMEYEFTEALEMKNYYFKVGAVDTAGNIFLSDAEMTFLPDQTAPTNITNIEAQADSMGVISLTWDPSHDTNMKGYWVYASYVADRDYMKLTDTVISQNSLVDSFNIGLLHHKRYYYIEAIDQSFNKSKPSDIVEVLLRDTIAPSATLIDSIFYMDNMLHINWLPCISEDVVSYEVQQLENEQWNTIATVSQEKNSYSVKYSENNPKVIFRVVAIDEVGNRRHDSPAYAYAVITENNTNWNIEVTQMGSNKTLQWEDIGAKYKIYQSDDDGYKLIKYQSENVISATPNKSYFVKAYDEKGKLLSTSSKVTL